MSLIDPVTEARAWREHLWDCWRREAVQLANRTKRKPVKVR